VINCGTASKPKYIPAEFCYVTGGQPARRLLSPDQTSKMIQFAARAPNVNAQSIESTGLQVMVATTAAQANQIVSALR
jgi:eukaryotic translation initiation factor 2C